MLSSSDIQLRYSGGSTNAYPSESYGGPMSSVSITDSTLDNLFDSSPSLIPDQDFYDYRAIYVINTNDTLSLRNITVCLDHNDNLGSIISLGIPCQDAQQNITFSGFPDILRGSFTLKIWADITSEINWSSDPNIFGNNIQTALRAISGLSGVVVGSPTIVGSYARYPVYFENESGNKKVPTLTINESTLATDSSLIIITIAAATQGKPINAIATDVGFSNNTPSGVSFAETLCYSPISIGTLNPGEWFYIWFQRYIPSSAETYYNTLDADTFTLHINGDSDD